MIADLVIAGDGLRLVLSDAVDVLRPDQPGLEVEVSNKDNGQGALVLDVDDVRQVRDFCDTWLTAYEATPMSAVPAAEEGEAAVVESVARAKRDLDRLRDLDRQRREASEDADREKAGMREVALFRAANAKAVMGGYAVDL